MSVLRDVRASLGTRSGLPCLIDLHFDWPRRDTVLEISSNLQGYVRNQLWRAGDSKSEEKERIFNHCVDSSQVTYTENIALRNSWKKLGLGYFTKTSCKLMKKWLLFYQNFMQAIKIDVCFDNTITSILAPTSSQSAEPYRTIF